MNHALNQYQCEACGKHFELIRKFSDPAGRNLSGCGGPVRKLLSSPAIQFKGTGWYVTDYARKSSTPSALGVGQRQQARSLRLDRRGREGQQARASSSTTQVGSGFSPDCRADTPLPQLQLFLRSNRVQVVAEGPGQVRPPEREVDDRRRKSSLLPVSWRTPSISQA